MNAHKRRLTAVLALALAATPFAMPLRPQPTSAETPQAEAWAEEMASMHRMHTAMAAVQPSASRDADFVRLMMPHHQAAVEMAEVQLKYGRDPQISRLAQEIITDQQSEMELMKLWLKNRQGQPAAK